MTLPPEDLRRAAGDFVAGDLDRQEAETFRSLLAEDAALRSDVDFWHRIRPVLQEPESKAGLGPGFAHSVAIRLDRERADRPRSVRLPLWGTSVALLAAGLVLAALLRSPEPESPGRMYSEDGALLTTTGPTGPWDQFMPLALVADVRIPDPDLGGTSRVRPWLGFWTRPVQIVHDGQHGGGHLVLRVAGGSPADGIGLRPGDVIRSLGDCPVFTAACIAHYLESVQPGASIAVDFWRPSTGEHIRANLTTQRLYE